MSHLKNMYSRSLNNIFHSSLENASGRRITTEKKTNRCLEYNKERQKLSLEFIDITNSMRKDVLSHLLNEGSIYSHKKYRNWFSKLEELERSFGFID